MHVPNILRAMPEKDSYEMMEMTDLEKTRTESALYHNPSRTYDDPHQIKAELRLQLDEAADMYGNIDEAQEHGYVTRGYVSGALASWMLWIDTDLASNRAIYNSSPLVVRSVQVCSSVSDEPSPKLDLLVCFLATLSLAPLSTL